MASGVVLTLTSNGQRVLRDVSTVLSEAANISPSTPKHADSNEATTSFVFERLSRRPRLR